jgi:hypothetical protein
MQIAWSVRSCFKYAMSCDTLVSKYVTQPENAVEASILNYVSAGMNWIP